MPVDKAKIAKRMKAYNARPEQKKHRAQRNAARAEAVAAGLIKGVGDTRDVHHIRSPMKGGSNAKSNVAVVPRSKNRASKAKMPVVVLKRPRKK